MKVLVGTTIAPYKMGQAVGFWSAWLHNYQATREVLNAAGVEFEYFAAIEIDRRGLDVYGSFLTMLAAANDGVSNRFWTFSLDDHSDEIHSGNRLIRITTGRNLITDYALHRAKADACLFLDADTLAPPDAIPRLLELDYPIVGGHVPTYCLDGPAVGNVLFDRTDWDVREHWNTAGFLLVREHLLRKLRWRTDLGAGLTDDPCYDQDARELGYPTLVRHDVVGAHYPTNIPPMEQRGHDRRVYR